MLIYSLPAVKENNKINNKTNNKSDLYWVDSETIEFFYIFGGHLENMSSRKMLNTYKLAYIGFEISTLKLTRIH